MVPCAIARVDAAVNRPENRPVRVVKDESVCAACALVIYVELRRAAAAFAEIVAIINVIQGSLLPELERKGRALAGWQCEIRIKHAVRGAGINVCEEGGSLRRIRAWIVTG